LPQASTTAKGEGFFIDMSKDPAFLFYSSDFLTGTMFMTNEQIGLYVRMLCAQHQHGGRIDTNVLRTQCDGITGGDTVYKKFKHDTTGSYNERLLAEMDKRKEKSLKAKESVEKRWERQRYERNTNVIRSENEIENENRDVITIEKQKNKSENFVYPNVSDKMKLSIAEFMEHRKSKKSPIKTQLQFDKWIAKLKKMAKSEGEAIAIIDNAIANGWTGIFSVSDSGSQKDKAGQRVSVNDEIDRILTRSVNEPRRLQ